jgi:hypothetical protein
MLKRMHASPAMVVALIALFSSLTGVAVGVGVAKAVPLAKRALVADNAKKLQGKTAAQIVASVPAPPAPPALTSIKDFVSVKTDTFSLGTGAAVLKVVDCGTGLTAISAGFEASNHLVVSSDTHPVTSDPTKWTIALFNFAPAPPTSGFIYVFCMK